MLVMLLGELLDRGKMLERMAALFLKITKDNRIAAAAATGFIGFLPMPGGSLLSAPFVDKLITQETKEKKRRFNREIENFKRKWKDVLIVGDPYYNQNLTLSREDFSVRRYKHA